MIDTYVTRNSTNNMCYTLAFGSFQYLPLAFGSFRLLSVAFGIYHGPRGFSPYSSTRVIVGFVITEKVKNYCNDWLECRLLGAMGNAL